MPENKVRRRCVFYVSGFDPKGAAHYHALYRQQAALQAMAGGMELDVGPRHRQPGGNAAWGVAAHGEGATVHTHYEFLRWDDLVREHWVRSQALLWLQFLGTTLAYVRGRTLWRMFCLSWPPAVALFTPFLLLCVAAVALPAGAALAAFAALDATRSHWFSVFSGALAVAVLAMAVRGVESRYSMYWLMRSYAFTARQARGEIPALQERLDTFAARIARQLQEGHDDEVLVVGHSSGAIMAVIAVARALEITAASSARVSLLTLGQWIPLLGLAPQAADFRGDLARLAESARLDWIDFSAPPDGCCFALVDPVAACGVDVPGGPGRPKLLSPQFALMFDAPTYARLRSDKRLLHFQYLMASRLPSRYDYFRITSGSLSLADRFRETPGVAGYAGLRPFRRGP